MILTVYSNRCINLPEGLPREIASSWSRARKDATNFYRSTLQRRKRSTRQ